MNTSQFNYFLYYSNSLSVFQGTWALDHLWMFWLMPMVGGVTGGLIYRCVLASKD
ncbi:hypothetical protein [Rahnella selenatireducens]|uniref:hypothetical protein n=1 Tax=Rahnella selenatireducens TaxID=3389797 RepID=UPI003968E841